MAGTRPILAFTVLGGFLIVLAGGQAVRSQNAPGTFSMQGSVTAAGKPLDGATVSIRGNGKTIVTTVFSDSRGAYRFPPLENGRYQLWAQAVGYEAARADVDPAGAVKYTRAVELRPLKDFQRQLSSNEWIASLPESDPKDMRMKEILVGECTGCHQVGYALQNRFDARGWNTIVEMMTKIQGSRGYVPADAKINPVIEAYREEIVAYLTRVRGPESAPIAPRLLPRPTGDAAGAVITEFDLPRPEQPDSILSHDGSIWSDGIPSRYAGRASHDVVVGADGTAYFSDDVSPVRTFGKIDPKTGRITNYKQNDKAGNLIGTHGILTAPSGLVWMNAQPLNTFLSFDPQTSEFHNYARPEGTAGVGGNVAIDSKGNLWATTSEGAVKMDPKTGAHTFYKADVKGCGTYGIAIDAEDKAWFAEQGCNAVGVVDQQGRVSRVTFPGKSAGYFTDKDRELTAKFLAEGVNVGSEYAPPLTKGPRRLSADPKGSYVWVADTFSNQIERIDMRTREVKEYTMPHAWSEPYATAVDKDHMVWINMLGRDAIARFDPATETFTEFQLPTRGTETRWVAIDNSTTPPTVWVPYNRVNRIARIQLRKGTAAQAPTQ